MSGRFFTETDTDKSAPVVIISENLAETFWPGEDPIGKRLQPGFSRKPMCTVAGVVGNVHQNGFAKKAPMAIYMPDSQAPVFLLGAAAFVVRTESNPQSLAGTFRRELQEIDKELPLYDVRTMEQLVSRSVSEPRFNMILLAVFAGLALTLASIGIYGVMAYSVAQRTQEIGVRVALGATTRNVLAMVVGEGLKMTVIGLTVGLTGAFLLTRVMASLLFQVSATDPLTFVMVGISLTAVGLLACFVPARRAAKVDPMIALRYE